uniref:Putative calcium-binding protein CML18 n=1 Tax=Davidia involucrata TaxID=16924 RepID=A0A5B7BU28_DAVIN
MPDSFRICLSSLQKFLHQLNAMKKVKTWRRRKPKRLFSDFNWSSFAAMEVSNQLKQVFKFMDANGDGKISPLELSEVLFSLGHEKSMATKEAQGMVREMDCNGDGFIDMEEFMNVMTNPDSQTGKEDDLLMDVFLIFDSDRNGFISARELQRVLISLGCDKCSLRECRRMIRGVDKDGDGFVDFEEFRSMML